MTRIRPKPAVAAAPGARPNELELRRILRALEARERYLYVSPRVEMAEDGYRIVSPCCSRRIDPEGGEIEIARIEPVESNGRWRLHRRDHVGQCWRIHAEFARLHELLAHLNRDADRLFWP